MNVSMPRIENGNCEFPIKHKNFMELDIKH